MVDKTTQGFNISRFKSHVGKTGLLRNNQFLVRMQLPASIQNHGINFTNTWREIEFACDTTNFPLTGLHTYSVQRYSYGGEEPRPLIPIFGPLQCTFLCDAAANMQKFFHEWMKTIVNNDFSEGIFQPSTTTGNIPSSVYELGYKESYAVNLQLYIFNSVGRINETDRNAPEGPVRIINFRDAYPSAVADVPMSWSRQNDIMKVPVVFGYTDWHEFD